MNRVRELRRQRKMTQQDLGDYIGLQKAAVCKYETSRTTMPQNVLMKLCDMFNVSADYLLGRTDVRTPPGVQGPAVVQLSGMQFVECMRVPVVGRVHAGLPMLAVENITEYLDVPISSKRLEDCFYMQVEGDCMDGDHILPGAYVLVKQQSQVENGQIAVVRMGDDVLLRRVRWKDGHLFLFPSNPKYEPIIVTDGEIQIIGRVTQIRIDAD